VTGIAHPREQVADRRTQKVTNRKNSSSQRSLALAALVAAALAGLVAATPARASYSLVWSDECDGTTLNTANWTPTVGNGCPSL
jgi:hypothetical protein